MTRKHLTVETFYDEISDFVLRNHAFRRGQTHVVELSVSEMVCFENLAAQRGVQELYEPTTISTSHILSAFRYPERQRLGGLAFSGSTVARLNMVDAPILLAQRLYPDCSDPVTQVGPVSIEKRIVWDLGSDDTEYPFLHVVEGISYFDEDDDYLEDVVFDPFESSADVMYVGVHDGGGPDDEDITLRQVASSYLSDRINHEAIILPTLEEQVGFWDETLHVSVEDAQEEMDDYMDKSDLRTAAACFRSLRRIILDQAGIVQ